MKYSIKEQIYPNYTYVLPFEENFESRPWYNYFNQNFTYNYLACVIYVFILFIGQKYMTKRTAVNPGNFLFLWNLSLCLFSSFGFIRMSAEIPVLYNRYKNFESSVCIPQLEYGPSAFWQVMFTLSKFIEFGDTFLLVARKKPVIFLHWYHHITVLLFTMHVVTRFSPIGRWMATVNYGVHMAMYGYYAITSKGIRLPKVLSVSITSLQLVQMFFGMTVAAYSIAYCDLKDNSSAYWGLVLYSSYAILFGNFFFESYCTPSAGKKKKLLVEGSSTTKIIMDRNGNYAVANGFKTKQG